MVDEQVTSGYTAGASRTLNPSQRRHAHIVSYRPEISCIDACARDVVALMK
jgi:hypothetical protein